MVISIVCLHRCLNEPTHQTVFLTFPLPFLSSNSLKVFLFVSVSLSLSLSLLWHFNSLPLFRHRKYRLEGRCQFPLARFLKLSPSIFLVVVVVVVASLLFLFQQRGEQLGVSSQNMGYLNSVLSSSSQVYADDGPVSGGGLSQNGKFSYGYASSPGKRSSMEDFYETRIDGVDGEIVGLFGVFDGHGGARAAEYVKQNLFSNLISHPKFISDTKSAIADAYSHTDSELLKSENNQNRDAGSTASTAILVGDRLLVANVGDSRAVICRGGNAIAVSRDHKPDQTDERQRIEDAGGFVMWAGTWRVGGVLAVSRAFGDRLLKQYVVADPEIQEEKIDSSLEFLILASDGLWDVVTNEEAVQMTKPIEDPEQAAKRLLEEAYQRGSADNITCVVVRFLANQGGGGTSRGSSA